MSARLGPERVGKTPVRRTLVCYAYHETPYAQNNLQFFVDVLRTQPWVDHVDYVFVVQGGKCSVKLPRHARVRRLDRENVGYDFGAHAAILESTDLEAYTHFMFLNSSVCGPFLPKYTRDHFTDLFTRLLVGNVKLVGSALACRPDTDPGGAGPRIEGFCFATDRVGLDVLRHPGTVFQQHPDKLSAVVEGEYGISRIMLNAGYNLDTLMFRYPSGRDWRQKQHWKCNQCEFPTRDHTNDGVSLHPLETVFHKTFWQSLDNAVMPMEARRYRQWYRKKHGLPWPKCEEHRGVRNAEKHGAPLAVSRAPRAAWMIYVPVIVACVVLGGLMLALWWTNRPAPLPWAGGV